MHAVLCESIRWAVATAQRWRRRPLDSAAQPSVQEQGRQHQADRRHLHKWEKCRNRVWAPQRTRHAATAPLPGAHAAHCQPSLPPAQPPPRPPTIFMSTCSEGPLQSFAGSPTAQAAARQGDAPSLPEPLGGGTLPEQHLLHPLQLQGRGHLQRHSERLLPTADAI